MSGILSDTTADNTEEDSSGLSDHDDDTLLSNSQFPSDHGDTPPPDSPILSDYAGTPPPDITNLSLDGEVASISDAQAMSTLHLMLSLEKVLSPEIKEAINQQEPAPSTVPFCSIGKGLCGEIYEKRGTGRIFKRELPEGVKKLWNDFTWHISIHKEILRPNVHFEKIRRVDIHLPPLQVPQVFS